MSVAALSPTQVKNMAVPLATAELGVAAALLGVVLAGLAIIVVFLNEDYVELLSRVEGGVEADFFPFWFTAALAVVAVVLASVTLIVAERLLPLALRLLVGISFWLFLWTLFATLNLVAFVGAHGSNRALQITRAAKLRKPNTQPTSRAGPLVDLAAKEDQGQ